MRCCCAPGRHGVADRLRQEGVAFETLDALYDRTEDFDELCELAVRAIIDRARQAQTLIYAVSEPQSDATVRALVQRCRTTWRSGCWAA